MFDIDPNDLLKHQAAMLTPRPADPTEPAPAPAPPQAPPQAAAVLTLISPYQAELLQVAADLYKALREIGRPEIPTADFRNDPLAYFQTAATRRRHVARQALLEFHDNHRVISALVVEKADG